MSSLRIIRKWRSNRLKLQRESSPHHNEKATKPLCKGTISKNWTDKAEVQSSFGNQQQRSARVCQLRIRPPKRKKAKSFFKVNDFRLSYPQNKYSDSIMGPSQRGSGGNAICRKNQDSSRLRWDSSSDLKIYTA